MIDKNYIFNVPVEHVRALLREVYRTPTKVWVNSIEEIGEFLQAYAQYVSHRGNEEDYLQQRENIVEALTNVLVCFGMIACQEGITQEEINKQIQKKALDGVEYPFDVREHAPLDQVLRDLKNCSTTRTLGQINPENSCFNCKTGELGNVTMTCQPLLEDALYYLQQVCGEAEGSDHK